MRHRPRVCRAPRRPRAASGPRGERSGPSPRSSASASRGWSRICTTTGSRTTDSHVRGVDRLAAEHDADAGVVGEPGPHPRGRTDAEHGADGHDEQLVAARGDLVDQPVGRARQVDDDGVVAAPGGRERLPHREGLQGLGTGADVPRQHAERPRPRQRVAQRPGTEPAGGLAQGIPAEAVGALEPEHPVEARSLRVAVDHHGLADARRALPQRARERGRSGATGAADDADHPAAGGAALGQVGEQLDQPGRRAGQLDHLLGAEPQRRAEQVVRCALVRDDVDVWPLLRRDPRHVLGQVGAEEYDGGAAPGRQRGQRLVAP